MSRPKPLQFKGYSINNAEVYVDKITGKPRVGVRVNANINLDETIMLKGWLEHVIEWGQKVEK